MITITCAIIYNPESGTGKKYKFISTAFQMLNEYGYQTNVYYTEYHGHATELAKNIPYVDLLISLGGDGTFSEVVKGNLQRKDPLVCANIPTGTTNDFCKMLGYGKNELRNLKLTLDGVVKDIDICTINGIPFVYVSAIGKFTNIPYDTPRELKKKFGYFAYLTEGVKSFFNRTKLYEIIYEIDGEKYQGLFSFIIISNANRISGINNFYRDIKLNDKVLEVLLCNITKKKDILKSLYLLSKYDVSKVPGIYSYKAKNLKIKFIDNPKSEWCCDGEKISTTGINFEIKIDNSIKMLIPKTNINILFTDNK